MLLAESLPREDHLQAVVVPRARHRSDARSVLVRRRLPDYGGFRPSQVSLRCFPTELPRVRSGHHDDRPLPVLLQVRRS